MLDGWAKKHREEDRVILVEDEEEEQGNAGRACLLYGKAITLMYIEYWNSLKTNLLLVAMF